MTNKKKWILVDRVEFNAYIRKRYAEKKAAGVCVKCSGEVGLDRFGRKLAYCDGCLSKFRERKAKK